MALTLLPAGAAYAASFNVSDEAGLVAAINTANSNGEADTITLEADITLTNVLPNITSEITIEGGNHRLERSPDAFGFRVLMVSAGGALTLNNISLRGGNPGLGNSGGGLLVEGTATVANSTISGNSAGSGGGVYVASGATLTLVGSTISGNTGTTAGGIYNAGGTVTVTNSTISNNTGTSAVGGLYNSAGSATLNNATVAKNSGGTIGGGIRRFGGTVTLSNTILADNSSTSDRDCSGTLSSAGANLVETVSSGCTLVGDLTGNITGLDPSLGALKNNGGPTQTRALLAGSVAIDAGNNATCAAVDQRGRARPFDGDGNGTPTCDIGAYEFVASTSISNFVWLDTNVDGLQDSDEFGVAGVTVRLLDSAGTTVLDETTTDSSGNYSFDVAAGTYIVEFVRPNGKVFTLRNQGTDDSIDSDANRSTGRSPQVTIGANGDDSVDAGLAQVRTTVMQSDGSTQVIEGAATDTYTVVLSAPPISGETVTIAPTFNSAQITVTPGTLTFTEADWNTPKTFTVAGVVDGITEGTHSETITHTAASSLGGSSPFDGVSVASVNVTIDDATFGPPVLLEPADGSTVYTGTPVLRWQNGGAASDYRVTLKDGSGSNVLKKTYAAGTVCSGPTCEVNLANEGITLNHNVTYTWVVRAILGADTADSATWSFTTSLVPPPFNLISPADGAVVNDSTPVLVWEEAAGATSYKVVLKDAAGATQLNQSYSAGSVCSGGACQLDLGTQGVTLNHNITYNWKVTASNTYGSTSSAKWFFTPSLLPGAFDLISPANTSTVLDAAPVLEWEAADGANQYKLVLKDAAGTTILSKTYNAVDVCVGSTCQRDLDADGVSLGHGVTYNWKVAAKNIYGETSSAKWTFTASLAPAAFNLLSPADGASVPTKKPVLQWEESANADTYKVVIKDSAGVLIHKKSYNAGDVCAAGTCQIDLAVEGISLKNGETYKWKVVAKNTYGKTKAGKWTFTVNVP
jgi:hypothetical protein